MGGPCSPGYPPPDGEPGFSAPGKGRQAGVQAPRRPRCLPPPNVGGPLYKFWAVPRFPAQVAGGGPGEDRPLSVQSPRGGGSQ